MNLRAHGLVWPISPLSEAAYSMDVGVDYYIWGLQIAGIGTLLSGINIVCTIPQDARARHEQA